MRGVYLRPLPDPIVPARHSSGARARAAQIQAFLRPLHALAGRRLPLLGTVELSVMGGEDWGRAFSYPYGLPFTRTRRSPAQAAGAGGPAVQLFVPADHPVRVLRRFDEVILRASRAGVRVPAAEHRVRSASLLEAPTPSGDVRELLDLVIGHEWGHAVAALADLRLRVHWLDELLASAVFLAGLRELGATETLERVLAWAEVQAAGGDDGRRDLGAFEYPRGRLRLPHLVWFQGVLTRRAWDLTGARDDPWAFLQLLHEAVQDVARGPGSRHRGDVARRLVEVEPSFRAWFATFGTAGGA